MVIALSTVGTRPERLAEPGVREAILGALCCLEDTQIRPRTGRGSLCSDCTGGCAPRGRRLHPSLRAAQTVDLPVPVRGRASNRRGEWASHIHLTPWKLGVRGLTPLTVQDSNLPCAVATAWPLFLLDEGLLSPERRLVEPMLRLVAGALEAYRDGAAYRFWSPLQGDRRDDCPRVGPANIPLEFAESFARTYVRGRNPFIRWLVDGQRVPPRWWLDSCLDRNENPSGASALFNVPADADDTALAMTFLHLFGCRGVEAKPADFSATRRLAEYRDLGRCRRDTHNHWIEPDSGAFLTWLRSEEKPTFACPAAGVMPLAVNNVCAVVNANVALALALTGERSMPGYRESLRLVAAAILRRAWPAAALYYPQRLMLPYAASRAYRDGGAREEPLPEAMRVVLLQLLDEQAGWARRHPRRAGAFPGGDDASDHLATALGVTALLNLGVETARAIGRATELEAAVKAGVRRLLEDGHRRRPWHPSTLATLGDRNATVWEWDSGLFFASSYWDMAHWRSRAYTAAMVLEALVKYVLGYDLGDAPGLSSRLLIIDAR
jgi:hypothetical protein